MENGIGNNIEKKNNISVTIFYIVFLFAAIFAGYLFYIDKYTVYLVDKDIILDNGNSYQVELLPKESKYYDINNYIFEVEDTSIAKVDKSGLVQGISNGTTYVKVRFKNSFETEKMKLEIKDVDVESIVVEEKVTLNKQNTEQLNVKVNNNEKVNVNLKYKSTNEDVVKIDETGNITGKSEGKATVIVESEEGKKSKIDVVVKETEEEIKSISFSSYKVSLDVGKTIRLKPSVTPKEASTKKLVWSSSNSNIASVSKEGKVQAKSSGVATITVKTDKGISSNVVVTVKKVEEQKVEEQKPTTPSDNKQTTPTKVEVEEDDEISVVPEAPAGAEEEYAESEDDDEEYEEYEEYEDYDPDTDDDNEGEEYEDDDDDGYEYDDEDDDTDVEYYDDDDDDDLEEVHFEYFDDEANLIKNNPNVATASLVNAIDNIIASNDSNTSSSDIVLNKTKIKIYEGDVIKLKAMINGKSKTVTWKSLDSKVVSVNSNGNVTGLKAGTTRVKAELNGKTAYCDVEVLKVEVEVTDVKINFKKLITINVGEIKELNATISPSKASSKNLVWSSNNSKIVKVDESGKIKGIKVGSAIIKVKTNNGKTDTINVVVKRNAKIVSINTDNRVLTVGETINLKANVLPTDTTNKSVSWVSNNTKVATVKDGKVTAVSPGIAAIKVVTVNKKIDKIKVVVKGNKELKLSLASNTIKLGEKPTIKVDGVTKNSSLTWVSSNSRICSIVEGVLHAKRTGKVKIIAKSKDNEVGSIDVTITGQRIHFIKPVEQGDIILLESNGKFALIDSGSTNDYNRIINYLYAYDITKLDFAILTHMHSDHVGGLINGINNDSAYMKKLIDKVYYKNGYTVKSESGNESRFKTIKNTFTQQNLKDGMVLTLGNKMSITLYNTELRKRDKSNCSFDYNKSCISLNLRGNKSKDYYDDNINSIVAYVQANNHTALLTGDLNQKDIYKHILGNKGINNSSTNKLDVFKISNHANENCTDYTNLNVYANKYIVSAKYGEDRNKCINYIKTNENTLLKADNVYFVRNIKNQRDTNNKIITKTQALLVNFTNQKVTASGGCQGKSKCEVKARSLVITTSNKTIKVGDSFKVKTRILPTNTAKKDIDWKSSDPTVATVDKNGNVKGLKAGSTIIKASLVSNSKKLDRIKVTVK